MGSSSGYRRATPFRLAAHRFQKAFRSPPLGSTWPEFIKDLSAQKVARETAFSHQFGWLLLAFVSLAASGITETLQIKTAWIDVSLPKVYLAFGLAFVCAISLMESLGVLLMGEYLRRVVNRLRRDYVAPSIVGLPYYSGSVWTNLFIASFDTLLTPVRINVAQTVALALVLIPAGLIYLGAYAMVVAQVAVHFLAGSRTAYFGDLFAIVAVLMLIVPPVLFLIALTPLRLEKNRQAIRWLFLIRIYKRSGVTPDHVAMWLK